MAELRARQGSSGHGRGQTLAVAETDARRLGVAPAVSRRYSHSIVAGGFELRSSATRFTPGISLMIRLEIVSSSS